MRVVKAISIFFFGTIVGTFAGFMVGVLAMPQPKPPYDHGAPGDGILAMFWMAVGLLVGALVSGYFASRVFTRGACRDPSSPYIDAR